MKRFSCIVCAAVLVLDPRSLAASAVQSSGGDAKCCTHAHTQDPANPPNANDYPATLCQTAVMGGCSDKPNSECTALTEPTLLELVCGYVEIIGYNPNYPFQPYFRVTQVQSQYADANDCYGDHCN